MCIRLRATPADLLHDEHGHRHQSSLDVFPCNGARKAIEHQVRKDKALKDNLGTLKRSDPDLWRQKVRSCRIRDANDPPGTTGVLNLDARRAIINRLKVTLAQKVAVQDIQQRKPITK